MRVIGTAGHVDHGKTTLIEALTGINPDRLPEEKARGMTIDLGFAWFSTPDGEPVGVIDVPGHERFIRNMVAGAWSLDCALLLVAADDGWMQQSEDHAAVLAALAVPATILVITKTDAATPERVRAVSGDALGRCRRIFGAELPCVDVSALTGSAIAELKALIVSTLAALPAAADLGFPYLYVDRVFTIQGAGLVVTGSLKGALMRRDEELELLPQGERIRVRALETYGVPVDRVAPTARVALNLAKPKADIKRGDCVTAPGAPFSCKAELFARVVPLRGSTEEAADRPPIKNHSEVEIALGTAHQIAQIHFLDDRRFARILLREPIPTLWGQAFLVIRHGGSTLLGSGRVLWSGDVRRESRGTLCAVLAALPDPMRSEDRFTLELRVNGRVPLPSGGTPAAAPGLTDDQTVVLGGWAFHAPWLQSLKSAILELTGQPAGASARELASKLRVDEQALATVLPILQRESRLLVRNGVYFTGKETPEASLSGQARRLLAEIEKLGRTGFELSTSRIEGAQREINVLVRTGMVVPLEGGIYYATGMYERLTGDILSGRQAGDRFTVPQAKERTGLSRKYTLPILNRMEKDGLLRRVGDERLVLGSEPA